MISTADFAANITAGDENLARLASAVNDAPGTFTTSTGAIVSNLRKRLDDIGYRVPVTFESGLSVADGAFTVEYDGQVYAAASSATPFTTTATFNPLQWRAIYAPRRFDSVAAMKLATSLAVGDVVETLGYYEPGDGGDARYIIVAEATGTADDALYHNLTGVTAQAKALFPCGVADIKQIGGKADDTTDAAPRAQAAFEAGIPVFMSPGDYYFGTEAVCPEGTGGERWSSDYAPIIFGTAPTLVSIRTDMETGYVIKMGGIDGSGDTQHGMARVEGIWFKGPGTATSTTYAIGLSQCRMAIVENNKFTGFPGGYAVKQYADDTGGGHNLRFQHNEVGVNYRPVSNVVGIEDDLLPWCMAGAVHLDGANGSGAAPNDTVIAFNQVKNILAAGVFMKGHNAIVAGNDSSANTRIIYNHWYAKPSREMEEVIPTSATTDTVTVPIKSKNNVTGAYVGKRLYVKNGTGQFQWRTITADVVSGANRTLTVDSAWTTIPDGTSKLDIRYGSAALTAEFGINNYPAGVYADNATTIAVHGCQFEDVSVPAYLRLPVNDEVKWDANTIRNCDGRDITYEQVGMTVGTSIMTRAQAVDNYDVNNVLTRHTLFRPQPLNDAGLGYDTPQLIGPCGIVMFAQLLGSTGRDGEVVRWRTTGGFRVILADGPIQGPLAVIVGKSGVTYADGSLVMVRLFAGMGRVKVTGSGSYRDRLSASTVAGKAQSNNAETDRDRILGYALQAWTESDTEIDYLVYS